MNLFFFLLGLSLLAFPIVAVVALVKSVGLGERLRRVEAQLATLERRIAALAPGTAAPDSPIEHPSEDATPPPRAAQEPQPPVTPASVPSSHLPSPRAA